MSLIRPLAQADLAAYRQVRLTALADHPEAFASAWEEERDYHDSIFLARMLPEPPSVALGGFVGASLVAIGSLIVSTRIKTRHTGSIYGVYVSPTCRAQGLGHDLMVGLIDAARGAGVLIVHLAVSVGNQSARHLYTQLGFVPYGLARRALWVGDRFVDEEHMMLELD